MNSRFNTRSAIKAKCRDCVGCVGVEYAEVERCDGRCVGVKKLVGTEVCPLHPHRMHSNGSDGKRLKAIRLHCLWCMGGVGRLGNKYVAECNGDGGKMGEDPVRHPCSLWEFRFGKNPNKAGKMSEESRKKASDRMRKINESRKINAQVNKYRLEKMEQAEGIPEEIQDGDWWVIIRNHGDEPMSVYGSLAEAEEALKEMNTP